MQRPVSPVGVLEMLVNREEQSCKYVILFKDWIEAESVCLARIAILAQDETCTICQAQEYPLVHDGHHAWPETRRMLVAPLI